MINFTTPLQGMQHAEDRVNLAADRIARMPSSATDPAAKDNVDLSTEMVALMESRNHFAANVKVVQADDEMTRSTLDLLA